MKNLQHKTKSFGAMVPNEDQIRNYAYHLFEQNGRAPGHDRENWLEAEACLKANITVHRSHPRLHTYLQGLGPAMQEELCEIPIESHNLAT